MRCAGARGPARWATGKIVVVPLERALRIRSGETDNSSVVEHGEEAYATGQGAIVVAQLEPSGEPSQA